MSVAGQRTNRLPREGAGRAVGRMDVAVHRSLAASRRLMKFEFRKSQHAGPHVPPQPCRHCEFRTGLRPTRVDETGWIKGSSPKEGDHKGRPYNYRHDVGAPLVGKLGSV
jgi:hypothetical protein